MWYDRNPVKCRVRMDLQSQNKLTESELNVLILIIKITVLKYNTLVVINLLIRVESECNQTTLSAGQCLDG